MHSKICVSGKVEDVIEKLFFLHIKFSCSDNITVRNNKAKFCKELHLNRCSEGLNTGVPSIFLQGGLKSDTMDFYIKHEL